MEWGKAGGVLLSVGGVRTPAATAPPAAWRGTLNPAQRDRLAAIHCDLSVKMARQQTEALRAGITPAELHYRELSLGDVLPSVVAAAHAAVARAAWELALGYVAVKFFSPEDELDPQDWFDAKARTGHAPWKRFSDGPVGGYAEQGEDVIWLRPFVDEAHLKRVCRHEVRHLYQYRHWGAGWRVADPAAERARREADAEAWATGGER